MFRLDEDVSEIVRPVVVIAVMSGLKARSLSQVQRQRRATQGQRQRSKAGVSQG